MSSGFKLTCLCVLPLLLTWACAPDLDSLSAEYGTGGSAGTSGNAGGSSSGKGPIPEACENLKRDPNESDVDCGGTSECAPCDTNLSCDSNKDCQSGFCKGSRCAEPSCADGVLNQDETAADCGGSCAPTSACDLEVACVVNQDCKSQYCKDELCADHCTSGVLEGDETDKDCGGSCETKCGDNKRCVESADCESAICFNNKCQPATCSDKVLNQDESDRDCGGICATMEKACGISARCNSGADCESWVCSKSKCVADIDVEPEDIVDSFEDGDFLLPSIEGRVGTWYKFGHPSGITTQEIDRIKRGESEFGLLHTAMGVEGWGSGVGVDLHNDGGTEADKDPYDASLYAGVTFWARADKNLNVAVVLPDANTDKAGGLCETCDHHWFKAVQVSEQWERHTVMFADLSLEPGTSPEPETFEATGIVALQFRMQSGLDYQLYLDDVAFVK